MAAPSKLLRLFNKTPINLLLRPSLVAGTSTKPSDFTSIPLFPTPDSASSRPLAGAELHPAWKLHFGMNSLPAVEHSRIEVRGRVVTPDRDEFEEPDDDEDQDDDDGDEFEDDLNDLDGDEDDDGDSADDSDE